MLNTATDQAEVVREDLKHHPQQAGLEETIPHGVAFSKIKE